MRLEDDMTSQRTSTFDDAVVNLGIRAYTLSVPLLGEQNSLVSLVDENSDDFLEGGRVIQFLKAAGTALVARANALAAAQSSIHETYRPHGCPSAHLAVAGEQLTYEGVGSGFLWLSRVLPEAARGNWDPYNAEGTALLQQRIETFQNLRRLNTPLLYVHSTQEAQQLLEKTISNMITI
jgi:hypothetical protein